LSSGAKLVESLSEQDFRKVSYGVYIDCALVLHFIGLGGTLFGRFFLHSKPCVFAIYFILDILYLWILLIALMYTNVQNTVYMVPLPNKNFTLRQHLPRFQPENLNKNAQIFERVNAMAARKGCTPSQLALAWVHHQGNDVCPIPGTTKIENFNQNVGALSVKLTPDEMAELESYAAAGEVLGDRYPEMAPTWMDSETPPLSSWKSE